MQARATLDRDARPTTLTSRSSLVCQAVRARWAVSDLQDDSKRGGWPCGGRREDHAARQRDGDMKARKTNAKRAHPRGHAVAPRSRRDAVVQPAFDLCTGTQRVRAGWLASSALAGGTLRGLLLAGGLAAVPLLVPHQASAQFVCGGSATGAEAPDGPRPDPSRPCPAATRHCH